MRKKKRILLEALPKQDPNYVCNSYDIIGDIAVFRSPEIRWRHSQIVANAIMKRHKNVKTVLAQAGSVQSHFRLRKLVHIAGEQKTTTIHKESGCHFSVDVGKCYFSPRLSYERMRVANEARHGEVVINMFAGVGCFSIVMARHSSVERVYSIDLNPVAVDFLKRNARLNDVYEMVIPMLGDSKEIIEEKLFHVADRVLMPLPEKAFEYLPYSLMALKKKGGWIHYYDFEHASKTESPIEKVNLKVAQNLETLGAMFNVPFGRVVRSVGPNWYQVVLDIHVHGA
jgi:tRNA (guanine37-N1)-methyltransferase